MRKQRFLQRGMALCLAVALLLGMVPGLEAPPRAAADDASGAVVYSFIPNAYPGDTTAADIRTLTTYQGTRNWRYVADTVGISASRAANQGAIVLSKTDGNNDGLLDPQWLAIEIDVPAPAPYTVSMRTYQRARSGDVGLYLLPADTAQDAIAGALTSDTLIGIDHQNRTTGDTWATSEVGQVDIRQAGKYILVIQAEARPLGQDCIYPVNVTFTSNDTFASVGLALGKNNTVQSGQILAPDVTALGEFGGSVPLEGAEIAFESGNADILEVLGDGRVAALQAGKTTLTAHVTMDGVTKDQSIEVTVEASAPLSGALQDYRFTRNAYPNDTEIDATKLTDYTAERKWAYAASQLTNTSTAGLKMTRMPAYMECTSELGDWVALKIQVPAAGRYNANISAYCYKNGGTASVYLLPYDSGITDFAGACTDANKLGEINTWRIASETAGAQSFALDSFAADQAGEHLLIFKMTAQTASMCAFMPVAFSLDGATELSALTLDIPEDLAAGDVVDFAVKGVASTGGAYPLDDAYVSCKAEPADVVSIEGGKLTALKNGSATVTIRAIAGGKIVSSTVPVTVSDDNKIAEILLEGSTRAAVEGSFKIAPAIRLQNGRTIWATSDQVSYAVTEESESGVVSIQDGSIRALKLGAAKIKASVIWRGNTYESAPVELTVTNDLTPLSGTKTEYKFFINAYTGEDSKNIEDYREYSEERPWAYVDATASGSATDGAVSLQTTMMQCVTSQGEWVALKIQVPAAGRYQASMNAFCRDRAGIMTLYAIPYSDQAAEDIAGNLMDIYKIGQVDAYYPTAGNRDIPMDDIEFDAAGEYLLVFQASGKNPSATGYAMYPGSLILDGVSVIDKVNVSLDYNQIGVGESAQFDLSAALSSDAAVDLSKAEVSYSVDNPEILQLDAEGKKVTALAAGEAQVIAQVSYKGFTAQGSATVTVGEDYGVAQIYLYGGENVYVGSNFQLQPAAELKNQKLLAIPDAPATYTIEDQSEENVLSVGADGTITANKVGSAHVKAEVTFRGKTFESETILIQVTEASASYTSLNLDFRTGVYPGDAFTDLRAVSDYSQYRPWAYVEDTISRAAYDSIVLNANFAQMVPMSEGEYIAFKVKVSESGDYLASMRTYSRYRCGIAGLYVFPYNAETRADVAGQLTDANKIGEVDTRSEENAYLTGDFGTMSFPEPGEYFVVLRVNGSTSSSEAAGEKYTLYPSWIAFENIGALKSAALTAEKQTLTIGETTATTLKLFRGDGEEIPVVAGELESLSYRSKNPAVATVSEDGVITGKSEGETTVTATVSRGGILREASVDITVSDPSELTRVSLQAPESIWVYGGVQLQAQAHMASGNVLNIGADDVEYILVSCQPEGAAELTADGMLTGNTVGKVQVKASSTFKGKTMETETVTIEILWDTLVNPAINTLEERANALENAKKYSWAKEKVEAAKTKADKYVDEADKLWNIIVPEGLPRYYHVGHKYDPDKFKCRYCGANVGAEYGSYAWIVDPLNTPFKIQCPDCRRQFPSNDFEKYYQLGIGEDGFYDPALAKQKNDELIAAGGQGYLKNVLYPEKDKELGVTDWGVDDGFGYQTGETYDGKNPIQYTYIAYYLHQGVWEGTRNATYVKSSARAGLEALADAFLYTGEAKYGRTGAILLDRIADVYPEFDWHQWGVFRGDNYRGKILDPVWECGLATEFANAYDVFLPIYNDPQVIRYLSGKAAQYGMENPKDSPGALRKNVEDNVLREIYKGAVDSKIAGNFGMHQNAVATAALALNQLPETGEWLEWIMAPGTITNTGASVKPCTGGNVLKQLVDVVDRDGAGNEAAPGYNTLWISNLIDIAELLHGYETYPSVDLYQNPKFAKMFTALINTVLGGYYSAQIGDSGSVANTALVLNIEPSLIGFQRLGDRRLAQAIYMKNGNSYDGLMGKITDPDPEKVAEDIRKVIEEDGELNLESDMQTGYGFAALRDGAKNKAPLKADALNTTRDFAVYFGRGTGHGHLDGLNLFMDAFGLNLLPDLGYPEQTGTQPHRIQWVSNTLSHNTVVVDETRQTGLSPHGTPSHFDDSGRVKVVDVDASNAYSQTDAYRRTVVMVEAEDDLSYGVDFFRVLGGKDHLYSFHAQSDTIAGTDGLDLTPQVDAQGNYVGSYAGPDVPWGQDPNTVTTSSSVANLKYPVGYTWLDNVRRDLSPEPVFAVDFKITDFRKILPTERDIHLRMTMVNDEAMSEVSIVRTTPPQMSNNPEHLEYVLVRNKGQEGLSTLFTNVLEPYEGERYIKTIEEASVVRTEGRPQLSDAVRALKITLESGRVDYVVYATNNQNTYRIDDLFDFRGFVGVYTLSGDEPVYRYLNDGEILGEDTGITAAYTGAVQSFTTELSLENQLVFTPDQAVDTAAITGQYVYVQNDGSENGAYKIEGAQVLENGDVALDLGDVTLIRAFQDADDMEKGYVYNIAKGQSLRIPLPHVVDTAPVFEPQSKLRIAAGKKLTVRVDATSPVEKELTYEGILLPSGAQFDPQSQTFTWTPSDRQIGTHTLGASASDGALTTRQYIEVEVFKSSGSNTTGGGTTGGGTTGGETTGGETTGGETTGGETTGGETTGGETTGGETTGGGQESNERFIDLGGFDWAKEPINRLADAGVIQGTSPNTYSPGKNITRADFTILLVRAFGITDGGAGQFADVSADKYYAAEVAAAKAAGIVDGVGGNRFNPEGAITREDMMVILARAMDKTGKQLSAADAAALQGFADSALVSDYARDAVSRLVKDGHIAGASGASIPRAIPPARRSRSSSAGFSKAAGFPMTVAISP